MPKLKEKEWTVELLPVRTADLETLRTIAVEAFAEDARRYGAMPDGIGTLAWHEEGRDDGSYLAVTAGGRLAGGARVFDLGEGRFRLGSLFVDPELHGRGIGKAALQNVEQRYPRAVGWSLDTPAGSVRNQRFYARAGYVKVGESRPDPASDFCLFDYAKLPLLREIRDADLFGQGSSPPAADESAYALRQAARAVLLDDAGRMALMHVAKDGYHKLPGGGIEGGEDVFAALRREMKEEAGASIEVTGEIGMTAEYVADYRLIQFSYAYSARVVGSPGESNFTDEEREGGFAAKWVKPEDALELMQNDRPASYSGHFIRCRDLAILRAFLERH
ncbi:GNAT family N-acetyltransferase [Saccharibacillus alkalitolerans]|uniref:GNAT family N-acetyltransferase n=1 Tax=Saccharibacillus alkalitolerans TaxID=2705290 RepID=A0ABX0F7R5_9BACL|nr:GNAT family N-acetyltransferase [Saccharibacillus alkalitolerans]NGZ77001.1 GNAT family N-acetyltransferase [Saccharibacillus alkalitolerans]